ncbi:MAG: 16S rRNA (cytosine(1402)-N(4))-methyltransferase RsmH [Chlorobi bacterium]|nr:16S rRNA (cytosine(1402)-N(4))-methyltransferase RsmH [Chlorobiota bacterium]
MTKKPDAYHIPVLLKESVDALNIRPDGVYVDATFGGGGHSREILKRLGPEGKLFAFDKDPDAAANVPDDPRLVFIPSDFRFLKNHLRFHGVRRIDGLLADLGISSHQIDTPERGFSYRFEGRLDMRMDAGGELEAAKIVNEYDEEELARIFSQYGELKNARNLAKAIVRYRKEKPIRTTTELVEAVSPHLPKKQANKMLSKLFQALRIEVNGELEALKDMLRQSAELIRPGGRLAVITYHSLEDRLVKRFIQSGNFEGKVEKDFYGNYSVPFKKMGKFITPSPAEVEANPRARSAKLRVAERTEQNDEK